MYNLTVQHHFLTLLLTLWESSFRVFPTKGEMYFPVCFCRTLVLTVSKIFISHPHQDCRKPQQGWKLRKKERLCYSYSENCRLRYKNLTTDPNQYVVIVLCYFTVKWEPTKTSPPQLLLSTDQYMQQQKPRKKNLSSIFCSGWVLVKSDARITFTLADEVFPKVLNLTGPCESPLYLLHG